MLSNSEFLIIGAGPTGLGAARQLSRNGCDAWNLIEASSHVGGLASSFVDSAGFTWDIGGHVQFSHYDYFDEAMLEFLDADQWNRHIRESWVWMRDRFIPYPLQNNIHRLPADDLYSCLEGLVEITRAPRPKPSNFGEWITAICGEGIADVFMRPYNFKVWAYPPEMMNSRWVGERVAATDLTAVLKNLVFDSDDYSWGPNRTFSFPKQGGTGSIWQSCASKLDQGKIALNTSVRHIDLDGHWLETQNGQRIEYEHLISTMPLTELIKVSGQSNLLDKAERGLLYSSSNIIGIGMRGRVPDNLKTKCWIYFSEDDCPFYRVTVFSNYADHNVPRDGEFWSLMCEVSESSFKPVDQAQLLESVITGLVNAKLVCDRSDIVSHWTFRTAYGYPTPGLHRDEVLDELIPFFEKHDVYSRGRFGLWKYEVSNQDHSFMQGVEVIERIINGRAEITAFDPERANSVKHPWPYAEWASVEPNRNDS